ncbi:MAG TPA: hypothetical protein VMW89_04245 [Desulfatiglandales bacterium]|nr:hypothetical protein [Desulfatiglandales bacterium]
MEALEGRDITRMTNKEVKEINKKSIIITDKRTGEEQSIEGDTVVVALGSNNGVFYCRSRRGQDACGFDPKGTTLLQLVGGE